MKIAADTNVLVRAIVEDDARQARLAQAALNNAEIVALTNTALCELAWVLSTNYRISRVDIESAIRTLISAANTEVDRPTIEAGLAMLQAGGDFADGIIAYEGGTMGADTFASFDKKAVRRLEQLQQNALLLA